MREWSFVLAPLGLTMYFLVYPDQFRTVLSWLSFLID